MSRLRGYPSLPNCLIKKKHYRKIAVNIATNANIGFLDQKDRVYYPNVLITEQHQNRPKFHQTAGVFLASYIRVVERKSQINNFEVLFSTFKSKPSNRLLTLYFRRF